MERQYIVAGDYNEFIGYLKDKKNQVYVSECWRLRGLRNPQVILVGTYYKRKDWREIEAELNIINAQIIKEL